MEKGDSVLVHSLEGIGRCIACVTAYLMFRHRWSFEKALDFLCNKRPDAAPNAGFVQQVIDQSIKSSTTLEMFMRIYVEVLSVSCLQKETSIGHVIPQI